MTTRGVVSVRTIKKISVGQELLLHYGQHYFKKSEKCECGSCYEAKVASQPTQEEVEQEEERRKELSFVLHKFRKIKDQRSAKLSRTRVENMNKGKQR